MHPARLFALPLAATVALSALAWAQSTVVPVPDPPPVRTALLEVDLNGTHAGDQARGKAKAAACTACHGPEGRPADPQYPQLAGQHERYLARQLALYAGGERAGGALADTMRPFSETLSPQDMRDVGAWFASRRPATGVAGELTITEGLYAGRKLHEIGRQLYHDGDAARGLPACAACHGPTGAGNPGPPWPCVAGQNPDYSARRLHEYRDGRIWYRDRHAFDTMAQVAAPLTDVEIAALASYLEGLHPRSDDPAPAR